MPERRQASYPLLRGERRHRRGGPPARLSRPLVIVLAAAVLLAAVAALWLAMPTSANRPAARLALTASLKTLTAGNYSAARTNAQQAIAADPRWPLAHAVLARAHLALGDGLAAEAAIARARDAGFPAERLHALIGEAALLQGQPDRALAEADQAAPVDAPAALRVRAQAIAALGSLSQGRALLATRLDQAPDDISAWVALARLRLDGGDLSGADAAATQAVARDRRLPDALLVKGEVVRSRFGLLAALPWFDAAQARDAYYHPALIERAATLGDAGRHVAMLAATRAALAARPGSPQVLYLQAVLAARAGRLDLARSLLARAAPGTAGLPGALLLGGALDHAAGRQERAIGAWRTLLARQPLNLAARRLLGAALLRSGDARGALEVLRPLVMRGDADGYSLTLAARGLEALGERDRAARILDRAATPLRGPDVPFASIDSLPVLAEAADEARPGATAALLRGYLNAGNAAAALGRAQRLAAAAQGAPTAQLVLGDAFAATGRYREAAAAYTRAADLDFTAPTLLRQVDALDRAGNGSAAAEALALYLAQNPQSAAGRRLLAARQLAAGHYRAAIETLEGLRPQSGLRDAALLTDLAYAYAGEGDGTVALRYGRSAYALMPLSPVTSDAYGWGLYQAGRPREAVQLLDKAASLAPMHGGIRWHLAQALAESGRPAEAKAAIRLALADPRFADRAPALALAAALD